MRAIACYSVNMAANDNIEIARALRRRDPDVLDALIQKYQHRLLRYLVHLAGSREVAEDFFQETWVRVLERGSQYNGRYDFTRWLFTVGHNLVMDDLRRRRPASLDSLAEQREGTFFDVPDPGQPSPLQLAVRREQAELAAAAIERLGPEYREALALRFHEDMPLEAIAEVTGVPVSTVKSRIYRGLNALATWLRGVSS